MSAIALIVAAGRGERFSAAAPKQYQPLAGQPVLRHSVRRFLRHEAVDDVVVVINPDDRSRYEAAVSGLTLSQPVAGGRDRQDSVCRGLEALAGKTPAHVLIHDAARPLIDAHTIARSLAALGTHTGAVPALAVTDSLLRATQGQVAEPVDRDGLWRAQTPQAFRFEAILQAHRQAAPARYTDDVAVLRAAGHDVAVVAGEESNMKITTQDDLHRAETILRSRMNDVRTGHGFDVHRFETGSRLMLCGVPIPHSAGLRGHSDADVGLHAITDAILGTIAAGDIGQHFPPSDEQWRDASSDIFLAHAASLVADCDGIISHIDVTLICEQPRIGPHREAMAHRVAEILNIDSGRVAIKATTTEGLGSIGRGEGIAAQALATVRLPGA